MTEPVLADQPARERLRDELDTTFFVEAGAGTGKTTALVARIVELVARDRLSMERLATITFTEAAAAELRDRVRQELERAAMLRPSELERLRCETASREVDLASVQTIHAFAGSLLRTYPLEAGLPPNFTMLDELEQERTFDDRFRAWLYDQVPDPTFPERRSAVRRVLALGMTADQLRDLATRVQDYRDLLEPTTVWPRPDEADPLGVSRRWGTELVALASAAEYEAFDPADKLAIELRRLRGIAERMAAVDDPEEALRLLRQSAPRSTVGNQSNWPTGRCKHIKSVLKDCADELSATLEAHRSAAFADLLVHLRDFTLAFTADCRRAGTATFHDLLTWTRDLLRDHPEVRRRAQSQFDRLFVDEFQDTDPLQVEIAWFLTSDPLQADERDWRKLRLVPGKLFIVGDPKQSIYRFRRADIGIYDEVYERLANPSDRVVLSQSFRSPAQLVDWFNHHFKEDMQRTPHVQPAYQPLHPRPSDMSDAHGFGVRHIGRRVDTAAERWREEAESVAGLAAQIVSGSSPWLVTDRAATAAAALGPDRAAAAGPADAAPAVRPTRFSDICVLIPTRTNLRGLERAFSREGVPFRMESGWLVLHTQEVRDLLSCLRAIDDPSDQVALVAALRSPAYACSDVDLLRWVDAGGRFDYERPGQVDDGPVRHALASLRAFHQVRMDHTPAALTEMFIRDRMLAVQAFGEQANARDALRRLRYVVSQARTLASSGQSTLRALCDWLESRQRENYYDAESPLPDADEDAVRFMTVHGSKGLEFPIVILTGLGVATSRAAPQSVDLVPDYHSDVLKIRRGGFLTAGYVRDTEKTMYEAEQRRLLYVATTRARDHLVLSLFHGKDACHATRVLARLAIRPELTSELTLESRPAIPPSVSLPSPAPGLPQDQHRAEEEAWLTHRQALIDRLAIQTIIAPSRLTHELDPTESDPPPEPDPQTFVRRTPRGRGGTALGRAVHAVLHVIDLATLAELQALAAVAARDENIPDLEDTVAQYVRNAVNSTPVQEALASGRYWREVPLGVSRSEGSILEGAIDLLYVTARGALCIVDYKTDYVAATEPAARVAKYRAQGEAYGLALQQATNQHIEAIKFVFPAAGSHSQSVDLEPTATLIVPRA